MNLVWRGFGAVALMFTGALIGCNEAPSQRQQEHGPAALAGPNTRGRPTPAGTGTTPATLADRPLGGFRGTLELTGAGGAVVRVPVEAQGRIVADGDGGSAWDLFFRDRSYLLSTNGLLGLNGGNAQWLSEQTADRRLRAEVVSLQPGVLDSPGLSFERDQATGVISGRAYLRIPTAGANLQPLSYTFRVHPAPDVVACTDGAGCGEGVCDDASGFCVPSSFRPGTFRLDDELLASHRGTRAWIEGPVLPETSVDGAGAPSLMGVWCAGDAVGFSGAWTFPGLPASAQLVMQRSGELRCIDARGSHRTRGPVPFISRDDLAAAGLMSVAGSPESVFATCWRELERVPGSAFDAGAQSNDYANFRGGFLDFEAECVSMGHVAAVLAAAQRTRLLYDDEVVAGRVSNRRVIGRILQQWVELHTFLLRQGLAMADPGLASQPTASDLLERAADGWTLVAKVLAYDAGPAMLDARQPDYRAGMTFGLCDLRTGCADPALRCQTLDQACPAGGVCAEPRCVLNDDPALPATGPTLGLAPALLDGLAAHLDVVTASLRGVTTSDHAGVRDRALESFGSAARQSLLIEIISTMIRRQADECPGGATPCAPPVWGAQWDRAYAGYAAAQARAVGAAFALVN